MTQLSNIFYDLVLIESPSPHISVAYISKSLHDNILQHIIKVFRAQACLIIVLCRIMPNKDKDELLMLPCSTEITIADDSITDAVDKKFI